MTPFVLLSAARSGSTVLYYALDAHPRVRARGELLNPSARSRHSLRAWLAASRGRRLLHRAAPASSHARWLADVFRPRRDVGALGFKLLYGQTSPSLWHALEREPRLHFVHLVRRNVLKAIVSLEVARRGRRFRVRPDEPWRFEKVRLDAALLPEALRARAGEIEAHRKRLAGRPHLEVHYEELLADPGALVGGVFRFLGVEEAGAGTLPLRKMTPDDLADAVENLDEVAAALRGTEFERLLDG
jgi:LPS sulfotransferase NodH